MTIAAATIFIPTEMTRHSNTVKVCKVVVSGQTSFSHKSRTAIRGDRGGNQGPRTRGARRQVTGRLGLVTADRAAVAVVYPNNQYHLLDTALLHCPFPARPRPARIKGERLEPNEKIW